MDSANDAVSESRRRLFDRIRREVPDGRVADAMETVPRESFISDEAAELAYADTPQPIGRGQTISQPFIVAVMVAAIEPTRSDLVLEVGTGSGYQAAVIAELVRRVVSVERIESLASSARERLAGLGYSNVRVELAEEELGWRREAPYDGIVVAAAAPTLPKELIEQLAVGGRMVVPVGGQESQELMQVTRTAHSYGVATLGACRFVPLIGKGAWSEDDRFGARRIKG